MSGRQREALTVERVARVFDVPPWLVSTSYPRPRFARLRWRLRRVWRLPERPQEDGS